MSSEKNRSCQVLSRELSKWLFRSFRFTVGYQTVPTVIETPFVSEEDMLDDLCPVNKPKDFESHLKHLDIVMGSYVS